MTELIADLFLSVDGFAAGENTGPFFDLGGPELEAWVRTELGRPQVLLMGRVTFQEMAAMTSSAGDEDSVRMTSLPKVVFSNTLDDAGKAWANTTVLSGDLTDGIRSLKRDSAGPVRSIGSGGRRSTRLTKTLRPSSRVSADANPGENPPAPCAI